jgi:hypothetical protein
MLQIIINIKFGKEQEQVLVQLLQIGQHTAILILQMMLMIILGAILVN